MMQGGMCREEEVEREGVVALPSHRSRILVVDDDEAVRSAFALALSGLACDLVLAEDGVEALDYVARNSVDLVFLDLRMPGIDGVRTLRILRHVRPKARLCILSAFVDEHMPSLIDLASERLDFELFRKPLDIDEIRALAVTLLEPTHSGPPHRRKLAAVPSLARALADKGSRTPQN